MTFAKQKAELEVALARGDFAVFYQPQVHAATGAVAAVECLLRWRHPQRGLLAPGAFLPGLEHDEGLIQDLGELVLRQACRDARAWPKIHIAVNVSAVQFRLPDMGDRLVAIAAAEGFALDRVEVEILETFYFENPSRMRDMLDILRAKGLRVALDDFGTGYASLSALLELPLDKLKIDASFVHKCHELKSASIIHAVVAAARSIGLKVTAEGVETEAQQSFLRAAGCHYLQGFLFSRPVEAEQITAMLAAASKA